jgi:hypothetical protein
MHCYTTATAQGSGGRKLGRLALGIWMVLLLSPGMALALTPWSLSINTNNVQSITDYGADRGKADNAAQIQRAIDVAATGGFTNGLRGGMVRIPPGEFSCGPLAMRSNVRLQLDAGAVLRLLDYRSYPGSPTNVAPFISGAGLTNIAVTGLGLIEGQGAPWWPGYKTNSRPVILFFPSCSRVLFEDFTISNPPTAHIALKGDGGNANFIGIKLIAPPSDGPVNPSHNTDGVDLAVTNVLFRNCFISTGDDNIAMGSSASLTRDVLITNCFFGDGHGCAIGSYTAGGVSNVTVVDCTFSNTGSGIRIKSARDRGGVVQNLNYSNLTMTNVDTAAIIYGYYEFGLGTLTKLNPQFVASYCLTNQNPARYRPPIFRNITISNVIATLSPSSRVPLLFLGLPDHPISDVVVTQMRLTSTSGKHPQIYNVTNVQFIDCMWELPADKILLWNADVTLTNRLAGVRSPVLERLAHDKGKPAVSPK